MVTTLIIFAIVIVLESFILLIVAIRFNRRDNLWTPYIQRSYKSNGGNELEVGLRRRGDKLVVSYIPSNSEDLSGALATAESDLRERAILLNSTTRELAR